MSKTLLIGAFAVALTMAGVMQGAENETPADKPAEKTITLEKPPLPGRFYGGVDYLYWWVKPAPLSVPLVSSGPIDATHHGLIGVPATDAAETSILYGAPSAPAQGGNNSQAFPAFSGVRLSAGYWLDDDRRFALEGSAFVLEKQSANYEIRGDSSGNPVLGIPVYNSVSYTIGTLTIRPGEDSLPFSLPDSTNRARANGIITGGTSIENTLQLWGANFSGAMNLYRDQSWELSGLLGFRYVDLSEDFAMTTDIEGLSGPYYGQNGTVWDRFDTRNQIYTANLGLRARYTDGPLAVEMSGTAAPGVNHQVQTVSGGFTSINFSAPNAAGTEGVFAQPSNEGRSASDKFCIVPEIQLKISYALTSWLRASIGYDFLYLSNVIRPTDQIDRQLPKGQTFNQADPTISSTSPGRKFQSTDFFAHGMSFGFEINF